MPELVDLAQGVYAWLHDDADLGRTNSGVVLDADGATIIDAQMLPSQASELAAATETMGFPIRRCILTSGNIEFCGGNSRFTLAAMFGSPVTSGHLDQPPNIEAYQHFWPEHAAEFDDLVTRPVSHVVTEANMVTPALELIPTAGHTAGNVMAHVPAAGVLFTGGMCSFGVTPLAFAGHPAAWSANLELVEHLAATGVRIVPGHGSIGGIEEVRALRGYLTAVVDAEGDPANVVAGPWDGWARRDLDAINVERAALIGAGDPSMPPSMARAIGLR